MPYRAEREKSQKHGEIRDSWYPKIGKRMNYKLIILMKYERF